MLYLIKCFLLILIICLPLNSSAYENKDEALLMLFLPDKNWIMETSQPSDNLRAMRYIHLQPSHEYILVHNIRKEQTNTFTINNFITNAYKEFKHTAEEKSCIVSDLESIKNSTPYQTWSYHYQCKRHHGITMMIDADPVNIYLISYVNDNNSSLPTMKNEIFSFTALCYQDQNKASSICYSLNGKIEKFATQNKK